VDILLIVDSSICGGIMDELKIIEPQNLDEGEASEETSEEEPKKPEAKPEEKSDSTEESPEKTEENKVDYDSLSVEELEHMIDSSIQALKRKKLPFPKKPGEEPDKEKMSINEPILEILSSVFELFRHKKEEPEPEPKPAKEMAKEFMKAIREKDTKISQLSAKLDETEKKLEKLVKPASKATETLSKKPSEKELVTFRDGAVGTWE